MAHIEALDDRAAKNYASLYLAYARRDWPGVLACARAEGFNGHPYGMEIRALGELGLVEEMVQAYQKAERDFRFEQPYLMLNVLAFSGQIEPVEKLLNLAFRKIDEDGKSYWTAVACLRSNPNDLAARGTLATLQQTTSRQGRRRAAAAHLQNLAGRMTPPTPLTSHSQSVISGSSGKCRKLIIAERCGGDAGRPFGGEAFGCFSFTSLSSSWTAIGACS